jgi:hypothetical protein
MAGRRSFLIFALSAVFLAGCRNRGELVENELRARDIQYREALEELSRIESHNQALQREIAAIRSGHPITPEQAAQVFGLKRIILGRGTGGYDNDNLPGDEMLQVVIEPRDASDHTIKTPGTVQIMALEITFQGLKVPIGEWSFGPDELRQSWKQALLGTGYTLRLPWQKLPQSENIRVAARLILPDQRVYEADRDVKVRLMPGRSHPVPAAPASPAPQGGAPLPLEACPPLLVPAQHDPGAGNTPTSHWQSVPLGDAVQLGPPVPLK